MQNNPYAITPGVDLAHSELRATLAVIGIQQRSYVADDALNHNFPCLRGVPRSLFISESLHSKLPAEVIGDTMLWLRIRETARVVCAALPMAATQSGETIEEAHASEARELVTA